jgi:hypothetical protein
MGRKVRAKKPRVFEAPAEAAPASAPAPAPSAVPQTDVDFEKVGNRLSELGVMDAPTDTLTRAAAPSAAVAEAPADVSAPAPEAPAPSPEPAAAPGEPDWLAELTRELKAAAPAESRDPRREALNLPPPPTLPSNLLAGLVEDESAPAAAGFTPASPPPASIPAEAMPASPPPSLSNLAPPPGSGSQSDVPWAVPAPAKDDWQLDLPQGAHAPAATGEAGGLPPAPVPPGDIYAGFGKDSAPPPSLGGAGAPPWQGGGHIPPAELPGPRGSYHGIRGNPGSHLITTVAILALVAAGGWWLVSRGDRTQEQLARLTGSLRETTEKLPGQTDSNGNLVTPERTVAMNGGVSGSVLLPPPDTSANSGGSIQALPSPAPGGSATAVIDFADVPAGQQNKPIVADGNEKMPEDIGFIASLQKAIAEKKAERSGDTVVDTSGQAHPETAVEKTVHNEELKQKFDAELAAYRQALVDAGSVAEAPRPSDFLGKNGGADYMGAKTAPLTAATSGTLLPPPAPADTAKANGLPPAQAFGANPAGLPVMNEPVQDQPRIRQLADFDVNALAPADDSQKIRIPKNIRPRMSTSDFPEMDVLSLVPNKGVIAYHNGTEGVLLLGESVDGWQLVGVGPESAEFRNGQRSYYVSANQ